MLIKKSQTKDFNSSEACFINLYDLPTKLLTLYTVKINGRHPKEKRNVNTECEEVYYVVSGSGTIHSEKGDFEIKQGDVYLIEKGEVYWTEGKELSLVVVNTPKWSFDQNMIVE